MKGDLSKMKELGDRAIVEFVNYIESDRFMNGLHDRKRNYREQLGYQNINKSKEN